MIILPEKAVIIKRDEAKPIENKSGLILSQEDLKPKLPNTGTIIFTAPELKEYQLCKVVFRESFSEPIEIEDYTDLLYFRDLNSSIYYIIKDDKR